jgi:antitoxin VapB
VNISTKRPAVLYFGLNSRRRLAHGPSLKDKEPDRLAREVAALAGESLTDTIRGALRERVERERLRRGQPGDLAALIRQIGEHCAALHGYDMRTQDEIVGYDDTGMWN